MIKFLTYMPLLFLFTMSQTDIQSRALIVRLVYLNNGKPASNQLIVLYEGHPSVSTVRSKQVTDKDGIARFRVSEPPPEKLWVYEDNGRIIGCAWADPISFQEILATGATIGRDSRFGKKCKGSQDTITRLGAKPGEIVMFVRKVSMWDNILRY